MMREMKKLRNCVNCGAPLNGYKCDYCGTEYKENIPITAVFDGYSATGTITICGQMRDVYISEIQSCHPYAIVGRTFDGTLE